MDNKNLIDSLGLDSINFVASVEVIQGDRLLGAFDFTKSDELNLTKEIKTSANKRCGRQKLTKLKKYLAQLKRLDLLSAKNQTNAPLTEIGN